ncbi:MAG TPA: DUF4129 domain-containing protein [Acidimicrobiales bacterium]|nr:DUF4129 domain-containing protein [Acidimicrobiales bacterium]
MLFASPETLPPPTPTGEEIRRGAEEILRRPEFQEPARSLYQRALDKLGELLGDVISAIVDGTSGAVAAWVLLAVVVGVLGYLVSRGVQADRRRRVPGDGAVVAYHADEELGRTFAEWDAEAIRLEASGNWRDAIRCRYRALVVALAGAGVVDEVPGRTAGEYRALVGAARPAVGEPFAGATELFEHAWYGNEATGPDEASAFRGLSEQVRIGTSS